MHINKTGIIIAYKWTFVLYFKKKSQALPIFIGINLTLLVFVYGLLLYNCILVEDSGHVQ